MFQKSVTIYRKCRHAMLTALFALMALITGCDEKPAWRGVGTDDKNTGHSRDRGSAREVNHGEP